MPAWARCPASTARAAHSVNAGGRRKLMGVGQRLIAGGAHVGGVVVVDGADLVNGILTPVYAELGLEFDPEATGSVAGEVRGATLDGVREAILEEYASRYELDSWELDEDDARACPEVGAGAPA